MELDMTKLPRFIQYYLRQGIFVQEELSKVTNTLEAPLPSCFRVNPNTSHTERIKQLLATQSSIQFAQANSIAPPRALPWYPTKDGAWQIDCGKSALSKLAREHEGIHAFRVFLLSETMKGNINRQELVSMIPTLLLDIESDHIVLDLCAAPGSKTSQVMERLCTRGSQGFVVANDANEKRGYLLVHLLQRIGLDKAVVTCHQGQEFPGLYKQDSTSDKIELIRTNVFDRVVCDVPCTGDGTIRKNKKIWGQWTPNGALSMHQTQLELALRAAALLKSNGLMVYSTCSFNPIENEAVIAELLRRADGALEVVDTTKILPELIRRPGRNSWQVAYLDKHQDAQMEWFHDYNNVPTKLKGFRIPRSMFPPSEETIRHSLQYCMRLFPTDQNTGGFFVTLLRKKHELPDGPLERGLPSYEALTSSRELFCQKCKATTHVLRNCPETYNGERMAKRKEEKQLERQKDMVFPLRGGFTKVSPVHWEWIKDYYGISDKFPQEKLCTRSSHATSIWLVDQHIQDKCLRGPHLNVLSTGIRMFATVSSSQFSNFRPTEEGLLILLPYVTKRVLHGTYNDVHQLLQSKLGSSCSFEQFSDPIKNASTSMVDESGIGPAILVLKENLSLDNSKFAIPVWIGAKSLGLLVDKAAQNELKDTLSARNAQ